LKLRISASLALPLDFATKTAAILAQRRKGKTYAASVIAEELVAAKQPFVALDPTGAWWGLRASADGQAAGLPVVILGGQHADLPLERTGGKLVAELVVEEPGYYVIDFSLFESGEAERQFAVDFGERLYRAKGQPGRDFPLHLFVDEADRFIPQQIRSGNKETSPRLLGAFEAIVRRGGLRGLGTTLISQRAAVVNKNVLEMLDVLIVLRTVGPNDREAIDSYVKAHGTGEERSALLRSLASLAIGEAWVWEPGAEPPLFQKVQIRERRTFNSSATPKPGERRVEPRRLAAVDLDKYRTRMAATIERAKADDPKALRARIAELERDMRAVATRGMVADPEDLERARREGRAEVAAGVAREAQQLVAGVVAQAEAGRRRAAAAIDQALGQLKAAADALREPIDVPEVAASAAETAAYKIGGRARTSAFAPSNEAAKIDMRRVAAPAATRSAAPGRQPSAPAAGLDGPMQRVLDALAWLEAAGVSAPYSRPQVAFLARYAPGTGAFGNALGRCSSAGLVSYPSPGFVVLTDDGRAAAQHPDAPGSAEDLQARVLERIDGPMRRCLEPLLAVYPHSMSRERLAAEAGYQPGTGAFQNALGRLRTVGAIDYPDRGHAQALPWLALEG